MGEQQLFSLHQTNYRLQYISIIVFAPLQNSSQKLLKYYWRDIYSLTPSTYAIAYADDS